MSGQTPEPVTFDPVAAAAEERGAAARARSERAVELMLPVIEAAAENPLRAPRHTPAAPMTRGAHLATDSFESAHNHLGRKLGLFTSGTITMVAAATALHRMLDAPPTPLEHHDPRPIGAGSHRVQAMIHLASFGDRLHLSLEADDGYLDDSEISALPRGIERTVIGLAQTCHAGVESFRWRASAIAETVHRWWPRSCYRPLRITSPIGKHCPPEA